MVDYLYLNFNSGDEFLSYIRKINRSIKLAIEDEYIVFKERKSNTVYRGVGALLYDTINYPAEGGKTELIASGVIDKYMINIISRGVAGKPVTYDDFIDKGGITVSFDPLRGYKPSMYETIEFISEEDLSDLLGNLKITGKQEFTFFTHEDNSIVRNGESYSRASDIVKNFNKELSYYKERLGDKDIYCIITFYPPEGNKNLKVRINKRLSVKLFIKTLVDTYKESNYVYSKSMAKGGID